MSPSPVIPGEPPVELTRPKSHTSQAEVPDDTTQSEANGEDLLPVDGGLAAWRLLLAAFVFEALLWGNRPPKPNTQLSMISLISTKAVSDEMRRLSSFIRSIPRLLHSATAIQRQLLHLGGRNYCMWLFLSGCAGHGPSRAAIS